MRYLKICPACGKKYETDMKGQICCSKSCGNKYRNEKNKQPEPEKRTCAICLGTFRGATNAKYCSPECEEEAARRRKAAKKAEDKRHGRKTSLSAINTRAREEGLSYGLYVAKHGV